VPAAAGRDGSEDNRKGKAPGRLVPSRSRRKESTPRDEVKSSSHKRVVVREGNITGSEKRGNGSA